MDSYTHFKEAVSLAVLEFRKLDAHETIKIVSHLDCDGISSAAILVKTLQNEQRTYSISIVQQLNEKVMQQINEEPYRYIFFTDLGSSQISLVEKIFAGKKVFVLDHHELDPKDAISQRVIASKHHAHDARAAVTAYEHVVHVNPVLFGIDGGREICGAGITYLFSRALNPANKELAHIAVIGAIGEVQEHNGFLSLNDEILQDALTCGSMLVKRGLRFFGMQTRPMHKVLEYSTDPYIPDVSGSESSAISWLHHIGIDPRHGKDWKRITQLSDDDMARLSSAIILQRMGRQENPEDIFGNVYLLRHEKDGSCFKDAKEFATLLNSCGRLNKASLGIGALLGDTKAKRAALENLAAYRKELIRAMKWYKENQENSSNIMKGNGYIIINAQDNILSTVTGTLASIVAKSNELSEGTVIVSMARTQEKTTKVSTRIAGYKRNYPIDLSLIIGAIIEHIEGASSGGHYQAAGAVIPCEQEALFLEKSVQVLDTLLPAMVAKLTVQTT